MSEVGEKRKNTTWVFKARGIGRFQVMALLQAARYYIAYDKSLEKAKSFGLSRAIFYAWAKHYGPHYRMPANITVLEKIAKRKEREKCPTGMHNVLGECIEVSRRGYYMIGGEEQTPAKFDREVLYRLKGIIDLKRAWESALKYVSQFPKEVLANPVRFYKYVYEPVRDTFFQMLVRGEEPKPSQHLLSRIESLKEIERKTKQKTLESFLKEREGN